jgi:hypothetical protein
MFSHIITFGSSLPEALGGHSLCAIICERVLRRATCYLQSIPQVHTAERSRPRALNAVDSVRCEGITNHFARLVGVSRNRPRDSSCRSHSERSRSVAARIDSCVPTHRPRMDSCLESRRRSHRGSGRNVVTRRGHLSRICVASSFVGPQCMHSYSRWNVSHC